MGGSKEQWCFEMKVSVFIPYYNDKLFLAESIESVLRQTFDYFELILLDHASDDGSSVVAHSYSDSRIRHLKMKRNLGAGGGLLFIEFLKVARGKYLKPFCADDIMERDCLQKLVSYLDKCPDKHVVFGDLSYVDYHGNLLSRSWYDTRAIYSELQIAKQYLWGNGSILPYPSSMIKASAISEMCFDKVVIQIADHFLWTNLIINGSKFGYIKDRIVRYRIHEKQMSSNKNPDIFRRSYFENILFPEVFVKVRDLRVIKEVFDKSRFVESLVDGDERFVEFIVSHFCVEHLPLPMKTWGLLKLHRILSNDIMRQEIELRFGYFLSDFRLMYSSIDFRSKEIVSIRWVLSKFKQWIMKRLRFYKDGPDIL